MKCANCSEDAKIELRYLGKSICPACFTKIIEKRISKNIRINKLIDKKDKIAVAISGGKDSIVLLQFLHGYCTERKISMIAMYVNRGDDFSKKSAKMCVKNCKKLGVEFHEFSFKEQWDVSVRDIVKITKTIKASNCSVCGVFRRGLLNIKSRELGCNKLATGHNLTDEAQTYLMNFVKSELNQFFTLGPKSLPVRKGFIQRIKPLRAVPEDEVKIYADLKGYYYVPEPCPCRQSSLRFSFMNYLEDIKTSRPGAEFAITKIGDQIAERLRKEIKGKPITCKQCGELGAQETCRICQYLKLK